ncbi:MAG: precorrin-6A/cobalt-precorrin-6A reductase, partial [Pseudanabaena sp. LacPavin_0818_WC45_MAG_42_6]|nr:precorrin-6A/cobalt-precorrin-6A reductase [Pseudanabaena sp. LacPavin_0818_WC45_MAG_42_6]
MKKILILGGTGDAVKLAAKLAITNEFEVISSLAGRTKKPSTLIGQVRIGGFGGADGLEVYLINTFRQVSLESRTPLSSAAITSLAFAKSTFADGQMPVTDGLKVYATQADTNTLLTFEGFASVTQIQSVIEKNTGV